MVEPRSERETVVTLRLTRELHERLKEAAMTGQRGFAAEVRRRLEASLAQSPAETNDQSFGGLPAAIQRAAAYAATMHSLPRGRDTSAYLAFERAVMDLIEAFRPEGKPAANPSDVENEAAFLAGAALAALGDRGVAAFARIRSKYRAEELSQETKP